MKKTTHEHRHDHCEHARLKYCRDCQKPYCLDCGAEWNQYAYSYPSYTLTTTNHTSDLTGCSGTFIPAMNVPEGTPTVYCSHS